MRDVDPDPGIALAPGRRVGVPAAEPLAHPVFAEAVRTRTTR